MARPLFTRQGPPPSTKTEGWLEVDLLGMRVQAWPRGGLQRLDVHPFAAAHRVRGRFAKPSAATYFDLQPGFWSINTAFPASSEIGGATNSSGVRPSGRPFWSLEGKWWKTRPLQVSDQIRLGVLGGGGKLGLQAWPSQAAQAGGGRRGEAGPAGRRQGGQAERAHWGCPFFDREGAGRVPWIFQGISLATLPARAWGVKLRQKVWYKGKEGADADSAGCYGSMGAIGRPRSPAQRPSRPGWDVSLAAGRAQRSGIFSDGQVPSLPAGAPGGRRCCPDVGRLRPEFCSACAARRSRRADTRSAVPRELEARMEHRGCLEERVSRRASGTRRWWGPARVLGAVRLISGGSASVTRARELSSSPARAFLSPGPEASGPGSRGQRPHVDKPRLPVHYHAKPSRARGEASWRLG